MKQNLAILCLLGLFIVSSYAALFGLSVASDGYFLSLQQLDPTTGSVTNVTAFANFTVPNVGYATMWNGNYTALLSCSDYSVRLVTINPSTGAVTSVTLNDGTAFVLPNGASTGVLLTDDQSGNIQLNTISQDGIIESGPNGTVTGYEYVDATLASDGKMLYFIGMDTDEDYYLFQLSLSNLATLSKIKLGFADNSVAAVNGLVWSAAMQSLVGVGSIQGRRTYVDIVTLNPSNGNMKALGLLAKESEFLDVYAFSPSMEKYFVACTPSSSSTSAHIITVSTSGTPSLASDEVIAGNVLNSLACD